MKKKSYKIVKTDLFKQQEKNLPSKVKKELKGVLKTIAKNPMKAPNSMGLFNPPSAEELKQWMSEVKPSTVDLVFEYLDQKSCLNKRGLRLAQEFYDKYIKAKKSIPSKRVSQNVIHYTNLRKPMGEV